MDTPPRPPPPPRRGPGSPAAAAFVASVLACGNQPQRFAAETLLLAVALCSSTGAPTLAGMHSEPVYKLLRAICTQRPEVVVYLTPDTLKVSLWHGVAPVSANLCPFTRYEVACLRYAIHQAWRSYVAQVPTAELSGSSAVFLHTARTTGLRFSLDDPLAERLAASMLEATCHALLWGSAGVAWRSPISSMAPLQVFAAGFLILKGTLHALRRNLRGQMWCAAVERRLVHHCLPLVYLRGSPRFVWSAHTQLLCTLRSGAALHIDPTKWVRGPTNIRHLGGSAHGRYPPALGSIWPGWWVAHEKRGCRRCASPAAPVRAAPTEWARLHGAGGLAEVLTVLQDTSHHTLVLPEDPGVRWVLAVGTVAHWSTRRCSWPLEDTKLWLRWPPWVHKHPHAVAQSWSGQLEWSKLRLATALYRIWELVPVDSTLCMAVGTHLASWATRGGNPRNFVCAAEAALLVAVALTVDFADNAATIFAHCCQGTAFVPPPGGSALQRHQYNELRRRLQVQMAQAWRHGGAAVNHGARAEWGQTVEQHGKALARHCDLQYGDGRCVPDWMCTLQRAR